MAEERRCQYSKCRKILPTVTSQGNPMTPYRQKTMKYCDNACGRRAASELRKEKLMAAERAMALADDWICRRI